MAYAVESWLEPSATAPAAVSIPMHTLLRMVFQRFFFSSLTTGLPVRVAYRLAAD
jgi:hypothetical protein